MRAGNLQGFRSGDGLTRLLWVNAGVFILIQLYLLFCYLRGVQPPLGEDLALSGSDQSEIMLGRPWAVLTHMFAHVDPFHFALNMIGLYVCGDMFRRSMDSRHVVALYLLSGLSGFALYFILYNLFPAVGGGHDTYILGASAAVMGIVIAVVTRRPDDMVRIFGLFEMKLIWLGVILVALDLVSIRKGDNTGGHIGHLGGALFGFWYASQLKLGRDRVKWLTRLLAALGRLGDRNRRKAVKRSNPRFKTDEEFNLEKRNRQRRVDEILDKISRSGYDSLTREEKEFLFRNAQK